MKIQTCIDLPFCFFLGSACMTRARACTRKIAPIRPPEDPFTDIIKGREKQQVTFPRGKSKHGEAVRIPALASSFSVSQIHNSSIFLATVTDGQRHVR